MSAEHLTFFFDLSRAHAAAARRMDTALGAVHGVGLGDLHLLHVLAHAPDQKLRRVDLAQQLGVTASGVTWMLRPLTQRGLVASQPSEEDGRVTFAVLTKAGKKLVNNALNTARHIAADYLDQRVAKDELKSAASVIARLA